MTSSTDLAVKAKEACNQRHPYPSPRPAKDWEKLQAQLKNEEKDEKLGETSLVKLFHDILKDAHRGFFYVGIIGCLAFITLAVEHYFEKFITTDLLKVQVASILATCGFFSVLCYLTLLATELGELGDYVRIFLGDHDNKFRTFLGLIGFYLSYAGLVIWSVGMFVHGSKVLQIILWSLLLCLPIIGIMEYNHIKKNEIKFTSKEKRILKDIEPTIKTLENIIHRYEDYQPLGEADQEFVARVFEHHPRKAAKLDGSQIKHFTVACHRLFEEVGSFYLVLKNGKMTQFSYNTCVMSYVERTYGEEGEAFWKKYMKI